MGTVYAAIETAEDELPGAEGVGDVSDIVSVVAEACEEVMEEYREAAEPFGGQGENAERADELEGWLSELQDFYPDEPSEERVEFDEDQARLEAIEQLLPEGTDPAKLTPEQAEEITEAVDDRRTRAEEINNEVDETLEAARNEATELLGGCPL
jgi:chromosome segregation ATPase